MLPVFFSFVKLNSWTQSKDNSEKDDCSVLLLCNLYIERNFFLFCLDNWSEISVTVMHFFIFVFVATIWSIQKLLFTVFNMLNFKVSLSHLLCKLVNNNNIIFIFIFILNNVTVTAVTAMIIVKKDDDSINFPSMVYRVDQKRQLLLPIQNAKKKKKKKN